MTSSDHHNKYNKHVMNISWFYLVTTSKARIGKDNILEESIAPELIIGTEF